MIPSQLGWPLFAVVNLQTTMSRLAASISKKDEKIFCLHHMGLVKFFCAYVLTFKLRKLLSWGGGEKLIQKPVLDRCK